MNNQVKMQSQTSTLMSKNLELDAEGSVGRASLVL